MSVVGTCPRCEKPVGLPQCPNCGGSSFAPGHDVDSGLAAWVCIKCKIAHVYVACPYCSTMIPAERFRARGCRLPGCLTLIVVSGLVCLVITLLGFLPPVDRYFRSIADSISAKQEQQQKTTGRTDGRRKPAKAPAQVAKRAAPPVDWTARYRQLYAAHLAQFKPPVLGQRVTIVLHGRTKMEGILRSVDAENLTLEIEGRGDITVTAAQFTEEDGSLFFSRHYAAFQAHLQLQREQAGQPAESGGAR